MNRIASTKRWIRGLLLFALIIGAVCGSGLLSSTTVYAADIDVGTGEQKISDLVADKGLAEGDNLYVRSGSVLNIDQDFTVGEIYSNLSNANLVIKGDKTLTVTGGVRLSADDSASFLTVESGELYVEGPANRSMIFGVCANKVTVNGGSLYIAFRTTEDEETCGLYSNVVAINGGRLRISADGSNKNHTSGIYSFAAPGSVTVKGGEVRISVGGDSEYVHGIYHKYGTGSGASYSTAFEGGKTTIDVYRRDDSSTSHGAYGIHSDSDAPLNFSMKEGAKLDITSSSKGYAAYGITGKDFNISGGELTVNAKSSNSGVNIFGLFAFDDPNLLISGGKVTINGLNDSTSPYRSGAGIRFDTETNNTRRLEFSGGTISVTGSRHGIYTEDSGDVFRNQITGDADITIVGETDFGIYGVQDKGWEIRDNAKVNITGGNYGMRTAGHLIFKGSPEVTIEGTAEQAVFARDTINISKPLGIKIPEGGKVADDTIDSTNGKTIVDASDQKAKKVVLGRNEKLADVKVIFMDALTGEQITDSIVQVRIDDEDWQPAWGEPVLVYPEKEIDFSLAAAPIEGSKYTDFYGWYKGSYPGDKFSEDATITQNISADTTYYAAFITYPLSVSEAKVTGVVDKTYNGKAQTQSPTVKLKIGSEDVTLKAGTDYELSYKNNVNAGTATMTITGKGNYNGTKDVTFKINKEADPSTDPNKKGADGTPVGPGASEAAADKAITGMTSDGDPKGSKYAPLKLQSTKQTKTNITVKWTKPSGATKYVLYGNKCGKKNKMKKVGEFTGKSKKVTKVAGKKLKKGTYYKFIIVALDKNNMVVSTSKVIHVTTKGGKYNNPKKVNVGKGVASKAKKLKAGKSLKLKAKQTGKKIKKHRALKYESSNTKIATVSGKGVIKAKSKGTCYVYAYAQNGVSKKVKVTVK